MLNLCLNQYAVVTYYLCFSCSNKLTNTTHSHIIIYNSTFPILDRYTNNMCMPYNLMSILIYNTDCTLEISYMYNYELKTCVCAWNKGVCKYFKVL